MSAKWGALLLATVVSLSACPDLLLLTACTLREKDPDGRTQIRRRGAT